MKKTEKNLWFKDPMIERRTFLRTTKKSDEMECAKQLIKIIKKEYRKYNNFLDVGCASGHYLHSINKYKKNIEYLGIDHNVTYINFAKKFFKNQNNVNFKHHNIYNLKKLKIKKYDIVFCCNVLLHVDNIFKALDNLLSKTKKALIVRSLFDEETHYSKLVYKESFYSDFRPKYFIHQNTYSYKIIKKYFKNKNFKIKFIEDQFEEKNLNNEFKKHSKMEGPSTTKVINKTQIAGNKIFKWKWLLVEPK